MSKRKSPAVNFYSSDFLTGTTFLTNKEVGGYIRLLLYQHQLGHLDSEMINQVLNDFNEEEKKKVLNKFSIDNSGKYFNKRMEEETIKKRKYSESRANNRKNKDNISKTYEEDMKNISKTYEKHMENEIEVVIENNKDIYSYIESNLNITINGYNYEKIEDFLKFYSNEILCYAVDKTIASGHKTLNYFFGIVKNWQQDNLKTLDEIKGQEKQKSNKGWDDEFWNE